MVDTVKRGVELMVSANHLLQGGFSVTKVQDAKQLLAGAQTLFKSWQHMGQQAPPDGLAEDDFAEDWEKEHKAVFMFSGCKDDQTSADVTIGNSHVGAMSTAFLNTMRRNPNQSFIQVLQNTRQYLAGTYEQIPQLSVGIKIDLNQPLYL